MRHWWKSHTMCSFLQVDVFGSWDQQSAPQQTATPNPSADPFGGDAFASQTKASLAGFL